MPGSLRYTETAPHQSCADLIECFWSVSAPEGRTAHRVLPDGCSDLIYNHTTDEVRVVGTMTCSVAVDLPPGAAITGVRFHPGVLPGLLRMDGAELRDANVRADLAVRSLFQTGRHEDSIQSWAFERWSRDHAAVQAALIALVHSDGSIAPGRLAHDAGLSDRQFRRRVVESTGVSPKQLSRILRFRKVIRTASSRACRSWAEIAGLAGYYDQAHMIGDFSEFAGASPDRFFQSAERVTPLS